MQYKNQLVYYTVVGEVKVFISVFFNFFSLDRNYPNTFHEEPNYVNSHVEVSNNPANYLKDENDYVNLNKQKKSLEEDKQGYVKSQQKRKKSAYVNDTDYSTSYGKISIKK